MSTWRSIRSFGRPQSVISHGPRKLMIGASSKCRPMTKLILRQGAFQRSISCRITHFLGECQCFQVAPKSTGQIGVGQLVAEIGVIQEHSAFRRRRR